MSMNLHCKVDGIEVDLYQTPTQITYMCLAQPSGNVACQVHGKKAKHALQIYIQWIKGRGNFISSGTVEDATSFREGMLEHAKKIDKISRKKKLEVYLL